jgi:hypothetical protein
VWPWLASGVGTHACGWPAVAAAWLAWGRGRWPSADLQLSAAPSVGAAGSVRWGGGRSSGDSHARLRADRVTLAGATPTILRVHSLDLSPPCGNPRLGLLGVSRWCLSDVGALRVGAAGLVRRRTTEGDNVRRLGGVTSAWLTLQLSPWCWRSMLLC